jgi:hypothetical protein
VLVASIPVEAHVRTARQLRNLRNRVERIEASLDGPDRNGKFRASVFLTSRVSVAQATRGESDQRQPEMSRLGSVGKKQPRAALPPPLIRRPPYRLPITGPDPSIVDLATAPDNLEWGCAKIGRAYPGGGQGLWAVRANCGMTIRAAKYPESALPLRKGSLRSEGRHEQH